MEIVVALLKVSVTLGVMGLAIWWSWKHRRDG